MNIFEDLCDFAELKYSQTMSFKSGRYNE